MIEKVEGIVIDVRRHSDRHNIVTLFTRSRGCVSFVSSAAAGRKGKMRAATLMPLACVAADVSFKAGQSLQTLPAVTPVRVWSRLYFNPVKSALVMFCADFLGSLLRSAPPDGVLYDYLVDSIAVLDRLPSARLANFHIALVAGTLAFMGIAPRVVEWRRGMVFDMQTAEFRFPDMPWLREGRGSVLSEEESAYVPLLARISFANMHRFRLSRVQRRRVLSLMLRYISFHLPFRAELKSLEVLEEVFS